MNNVTTIKPEHANEIRTIFRKLIASGALDKDKAIAKIMRDYPHFFREPTADELKKSFHAAMNDEMRARALQPTSRPTYDIFRAPTDKQKPS
jgi:hypothetical protein